MKLKERFEKYAADVELSSIDGEWDRLRRHFADGAVHERQVGGLYNFRHQGVEAIISGFCESAEAIDRRFDRRILVPTGEVIESRRRTEMPWVCLFVLDGVPACVDEGIEVATYEGDQIKHLRGVYSAEAVDRLLLWARAHGHLVQGVAEYMFAAR